MISFSFLISLTPYAVQVQMLLSFSISHFGSPEALGNGVMLDYFFSSILKEDVGFFVMSRDQFYINLWELVKVYIKAPRKLFRGFNILFTSLLGNTWGTQRRGGQGTHSKPRLPRGGACQALVSWHQHPSLWKHGSAFCGDAGKLDIDLYVLWLSQPNSLLLLHTILLSLTDAEGRVSM